MVKTEPFDPAQYLTSPESQTDLLNDALSSANDAPPHRVMLKSRNDRISARHFPDLLCLPRELPHKRARTIRIIPRDIKRNVANRFPGLRRENNPHQSPS